RSRLLCRGLLRRGLLRRGRLRRGLRSALAAAAGGGLPRRLAGGACAGLLRGRVGAFDLLPPLLESAQDVSPQFRLVPAAPVGQATIAALAAGAGARGQGVLLHQVAGAVPGGAGTPDARAQRACVELAQAVDAAVVVERHFPLVEQLGGLGTGDGHAASPRVGCRQWSTGDV